MYNARNIDMTKSLLLYSVILLSLSCLNAGEKKEEEKKFTPSKAEKADAVLRVKKTKDLGGSKYIHCTLKVLQVYKNKTGKELNGKEIKVAYYSMGAGIPEGECTVYILPYNPSNPTAKNLWRLVETIGAQKEPGFSHHEKK